MGRSAIPAALGQLNNPTSAEAQVEALRNLKNEIVGHEQRKELAVRHGLVTPLAGILRTEARKGGKRRRSNLNGNGSASSREGEPAQQWSVEDELRFQATLVVGSLANGGPAFIAPMLAGSILPPLLEALSPAEIPSKLIIATLRTLNQIVDATAQEKPWIDATDGPASSSLFTRVCDEIYTKPVLERLHEILAQPTRTAPVPKELSLTAKLISKTCRQKSQRYLMLDGGILDQLASKLSVMAAADAQALRMESQHSTRDELPAMHLPDLLEAISALIKDSNYLIGRFLYSQPIRQIFGSSKDGSTAPYDGMTTPTQATPWDRLIPRLQTMQSKADPYTKAWPALGAFGQTTPIEYPARSGSDGVQGNNRTLITEESETPLFIWLTHVARRSEGKARLSACWLLALLKGYSEKWPLNDPSKITRERHYSILIIPLVVEMIEEANPAASEKSELYQKMSTEDMQFVLERAPLVLAELVSSNKALQNAAVEARVLATLVQTLKKSFEPITTHSKQLWSPWPAHARARDPTTREPSSTLGAPGLGPEVLHAFRYRESTLLALAAMSDTQDALRKQIIDAGAASHLIEALVPYSNTPTDPSSSSPAQNTGTSTAKRGNPVPVLIAACKLTRSLSRSISVLRTSLIDHGIAQPSIDLLSHPDVAVQIAATEVITNLVLEVSPMRTEIMEAGVLKILCKQCRSANFELRLGSLWALKHLCLSLSSAMKQQCLDELGVGWLVQILGGDPPRGTAPTPFGMGTPNAAGEHVDILNAEDDPHMDVDDSPSSSEDDDVMRDSIPSMRRHAHIGSRYTSTSSIRERLQMVKNDEQDTRLKNERDDIRIQEQALDFIRNFINEDKAAGEMVDHLLSAFGHTRFFELLDSKIRPKLTSTSGIASPSQHTTSTNQPQSFWPNNRGAFSPTTTLPPPFTTAASPTSQQPSPFNTPQNWSAYPPTELIVGTMYILVHLANGRPAHRSLLISQTQLMQHILPLFAHPRKEVRVPCAWFLCNLTWVDDAAEEPASRERAVILRTMRFDEGARFLARDSELDIRERAKTAVEQFTRLLGPSASGMEYGAHSRGGGGFGAREDNGLGRLGGVGHGAWRRDGGL